MKMQAYTKRELKGGMIKVEKEGVQRRREDTPLQFEV
jgi:hypothetical protein